jgi:hypothetical protein
MHRFRAFMAKYYPEADRSGSGPMMAFNEGSRVLPYPSANKPTTTRPGKVPGPATFPCTTPLAEGAPGRVLRASVSVVDLQEVKEAKGRVLINASSPSPLPGL